MAARFRRLMRGRHLAIAALLAGLLSGGTAQAEEMASYADQRFFFSLTYPVAWSVQFTEVPEALIERAAEHLSGVERLETLPVGFHHLRLVEFTSNREAQIGRRAVSPRCEVAYRPSTSVASFPQLVGLYAKKLSDLSPFVTWNKEFSQQEPPVMIAEYPVFFDDGAAAYSFDALIETQTRRGLFVLTCADVAQSEQAYHREHFLSMVKSFQQQSHSRIVNSR